MTVLTKHRSSDLLPLGCKNQQRSMSVQQFRWCSYSYQFHFKESMRNGHTWRISRLETENRQNPAISDVSPERTNESLSPGERTNPCRRRCPPENLQNSTPPQHLPEKMFCHFNAIGGIFNGTPTYLTAM